MKIITVVKNMYHSDMHRSINSEQSQVLSQLFKLVDGDVFEESFNRAYKKIIIEKDFSGYEEFMAFHKEKGDLSRQEDKDDGFIMKELKSHMLMNETIKNVIESGEDKMFSLETLEMNDFSFDKKGNIVENKTSFQGNLLDTMKTILKSSLKDYNAIHMAPMKLAFELTMEYCEHSDRF